MEVIKSNPNRTEEEQLDFYEQMFIALADNIRLKFVHSIRHSDTKYLYVCNFEELLELKQSKLYYHLKKLVETNILIAEKHGTWNYYKINEQQIQVVLNEDTCCKIL